MLVPVLAVTPPHVALRPSVAALNQPTTISVAGVKSGTLQVLLAGATDARGKQLPWRSLRRVDGAWVGALPSPALLGLYPIQLRAAPGSPSFGSRRWLLRVLEPGTLLLPSFASPAEVARWWVRAIPRARLTAMKPWPRPAFDARDTRLHRLYVVAYQPPGTSTRRDRRGMSSRPSATATTAAGASSRRASFPRTEPAYAGSVPSSVEP